MADVSEKEREALQGARDLRDTVADAILTIRENAPLHDARDRGDHRICLRRDAAPLSALVSRARLLRAYVKGHHEINTFRLRGARNTLARGVLHSGCTTQGNAMSQQNQNPNQGGQQNKQPGQGGGQQGGQQQEPGQQNQQPGQGGQQNQGDKNQDDRALAARRTRCPGQRPGFLHVIC